MNPSGWTTRRGKTDTLWGPQSEKAGEVARSISTAFDAVQVAALSGCPERRDWASRCTANLRRSVNLIQSWWTQLDHGELNDEEAGANVITEYEAQIAPLERKCVGFAVYLHQSEPARREQGGKQPVPAWRISKANLLCTAVALELNCGWQDFPD